MMSTFHFAKSRICVQTYIFPSLLFLVFFYLWKKNHECNWYCFFFYSFLFLAFFFMWDHSLYVHLQLLLLKSKLNIRSFYRRVADRFTPSLQHDCFYLYQNIYGQKSIFSSETISESICIFSCVLFLPKLITYSRKPLQKWSYFLQSS